MRALLQLRRYRVIGAAGASLILGCLIHTGAANASVSGFTGSFLPNTWVFQVNGGDPISPPSCATEGPCLDTTGSDLGTAYLGQEDDGEQALSTVSWSWLNPADSPTSYLVSFTYFVDVDPDEELEPYATYQVGLVNSGNLYFTDEEIPIGPLLLSPGHSIVYTVSVPINSSPAGLQITNFNFTAEVPAPLPASGAASAFAFSRRLRRRVKTNKLKKIPKTTTKDFPDSYLNQLNLTTSALQSTPISFEYFTSLHRTELDLPDLAMNRAMDTGGGWS